MNLGDYKKSPQKLNFDGDLNMNQDLYNDAYESGFEAGYAEAESELQDAFDRKLDREINDAYGVGFEDAKKQYGEEIADLEADRDELKERALEDRETIKILMAKLRAADKALLEIKGIVGDSEVGDIAAAALSVTQR